jgi:DTW domain-containing protein
MHYIEALRSTNTGRLAAQMLTGSSVHLRGDRSEPSELPAGKRLLLFPLEGARVLSPKDAGIGVTLVVPDGTWGQARRIARRDSMAVGAEVVTLPETIEGLYGLRRSQRPGGLCTLEAIAVALGVLEGHAITQTMMDVFEIWHTRALAVRHGR